MLFGYADMLAQCVPCLTGTGITEPVRLALAAFIDSIICCKFQGYRLEPDNANGNLVTDFSNPDPFEDIPNVMTRGLIPKFGPECLRQLAQWPAMDHVRINIAARYGMRSAPLGNQCDMPLPLIEQELRWWVHLRDTIKVAT